MKSMKFLANKRYLLLPIANNTGWFLPTKDLQYLCVYQNGKKVEEYEVILSRNPRCWSCIFLDAYQGEELEVQLEGGDESLIELLEISDTLKDADTLYREPERPFVHFTPMHGFMNDPNGLFYYNGMYHYFSQLNPFGFGACNTHWLHAVSKDLMHWEELPYALLPDETGRMYSGSGVVDYHNTSGMQTGSEPPIFLFYTPAGGKSRWGRGKYFEIAAAISTDGGKTYQKYEKNPVVPFISFMNRDPKVVWDPEGNDWVMAIFLDNDRYMLLYSDNLLNWEQGQIISVPGSAECPDIFRLPLDGDPTQYKWVLWACTDNYIVGQIKNRTFIPETDVIEGPIHQIHSAYSKLARTTGGYAAQTYFGAPEGRIIQHSWIRTRPTHAPFSSCTSVPNELTLVSTKAGPRLSVYPAKEIEIMYESEFSFKSRGLEEFERIPMTALGECMDIKMKIDVNGEKLISFSVRGVLIVYDPRTGYLLLPTNAFQIGKNLPQLDLRIITDKCSMEIYTGDGLFNTALCTVLDPTNVSIKPIWVDADIALDFEVHKLRNSWTEQ